MSTTTNRNMNQSNHEPLTKCQQQIESVMSELRIAIDTATKISESEQQKLFQADLCLASRSAYFDFYTWVVLNGTVDEPAEKELNSLFQKTLDVMLPGEFRESVESRYEEFKSVCRRARDGSQLISDSPSRK